MTILKFVKISSDNMYWPTDIILFLELPFSGTKVARKEKLGIYKEGIKTVSTKIQQPA